MFCKVCNTRIAKGRSACPNCGSNTIQRTPDRPTRLRNVLPQADYEVKAGPGDSGDLDVTAEVEEMTEQVPEVELDEAAEVELNEPAEVELNEPAEVELDLSSQIEDPKGETGSGELEEKDDPPTVSSGSQKRSVGSPDPDALRGMLAEQPGLLEPGLSIYTSEKGTPQGVGYTSAVGEIDLLAWDAQGGLVVVMVVGCEDGAELISGMLQRIGWVSKHLSGKGQRVRGIVLLEEVHESIAYAAAAVGDTLAFKTWQVALTFDDVEF
jgi:predicted  nucleic acid-binding Zn-ribbon protein